MHLHLKIFRSGLWDHTGIAQDKTMGPETFLPKDKIDTISQLQQWFLRHLYIFSFERKVSGPLFYLVQYQCGLIAHCWILSNEGECLRNHCCSWLMVSILSFGRNVSGPIVLSCAMPVQDKTKGLRSFFQRRRYICLMYISRFSIRDKVTLRSLKLHFYVERMWSSGLICPTGSQSYQGY
jgi:hypothetical protein